MNNIKCEKCDSEMILQPCCCSERNAGFETKYVCVKCTFTILNKKESELINVSN